MNLLLPLEWFGYAAGTSSVSGDAMGISADDISSWSNNNKGDDNLGGGGGISSSSTHISLGNFSGSSSSSPPSSSNNNKGDNNLGGGGGGISSSSSSSSCKKQNAITTSSSSKSTSKKARVQVAVVETISEDAGDGVMDSGLNDDVIDMFGSSTTTEKKTTPPPAAVPQMPSSPPQHVYDEKWSALLDGLSLKINRVEEDLVTVERAIRTASTLRLWDWTWKFQDQKDIDNVIKLLVLSLIHISEPTRPC